MNLYVELPGDQGIPSIAREPALLGILYLGAQGLSRPAPAPMGWRCPAVQNVGHLRRHPVRGHGERLVDVDVALGYAPSGVTQQRGNRQFREAKIGGKAGEGVAERMRRDAREPRHLADPIQNADNSDEVAVSPVRRKEEGRLRPRVFGTSSWRL